MVKVEQIGGYGEEINGIVLRPDQVTVVGAIDDEKKYVVAMKLRTDDLAEPLVLWFPLDFAPTLIRLLQEKSDELNAGMTSPRI